MSDNNIRDQQAPVRARENIRLMDETKLNRYRLAVEMLMESQDSRGYGYMATVHGGLPLGHPCGFIPNYCQHGSRYFTTWHRAYVYELEQRLQDLQHPNQPNYFKDVTVPYWDWTSEWSIQNGMPPAFTEATYVDPLSHETKPNPLLKWRNLLNVPSGVTNCNFSAYANTTRRPSPPSVLKELKDDVDKALKDTKFSDFTKALEGVHGRLHGWVGGAMGSVPTAAFDPIFWSHHSNVDRQFWQWQQSNPRIPKDVRNWITQPFPYKGDDLLEIENLGYTYAESEHVIARSEGQLLAPMSDEAAPSHTMHFNIETLNHVPAKAKLHFHGLHHTVESHEVRLYANNLLADANSGTDPSQGYLGTLFLFGHGQCIGDIGHCSLPRGPRRPFDLRPAHHLTPFNTLINISRNVKALASGAGPGKKLSLTMVILDSDRKQVPPSTIKFDAIALVCD